jgi:UDP-N-acetylmuramate: L-alanyl-gamma-D-glutamyl-meso-diaminopimelate ligase
VVTRGNPLMEAILDAGAPYTSGPQWLADQVLQGRHVLAVAGTHGKTTTTSMLAWMLEQAGLQPGFLVGGVPLNFGVSARLGRAGAPFVIEADEYDTALLRQAQQVRALPPAHRGPEQPGMDHADIFPDLAAIETQFHHLVRTVPAQRPLVVNARDEALAARAGARLLERGAALRHRKEEPGGCARAASRMPSTCCAAA